MLPACPSASRFTSWIRFRHAEDVGEDGQPQHVFFLTDERRRIFRSCRSVRQAQHVFGNNLALDLRAAGIDRRWPCPQEHVRGIDCRVGIQPVQAAGEFAGKFEQGIGDALEQFTLMNFRIETSGPMLAPLLSKPR